MTRAQQIAKAVLEESSSHIAAAARNQRASANFGLDIAAAMQALEKARRINAGEYITCEVCEDLVFEERGTRTYCSNACKQKAWRERKRTKGVPPISVPTMNS